RNLISQRPREDESTPTSVDGAREHIHTPRPHAVLLQGPHRRYGRLMGAMPLPIERWGQNHRRPGDTLGQKGRFGDICMAPASSAPLLAGETAGRDNVAITLGEEFFGGDANAFRTNP